MGSIARGEGAYTWDGSQSGSHLGFVGHGAKGVAPLFAERRRDVADVLAEGVHLATEGQSGEARGYIHATGTNEPFTATWNGSRSRTRKASGHISNLWDTPLEPLAPFNGSLDRFPDIQPSSRLVDLLSSR
eukprot:1195739-Prorocentrum_minimum.AAC.3